jgi:TolB-like protein/DNA-binding transcriptional LysR family regulator
MQAVDSHTFCFEGFTLDLKRGCLRDEEGEIELRPKSFVLLLYLVENAGRLVSKAELVKAVWSQIVVSDESLTRCVSDVRLALGDSDQRIIKTVPRRGYLFAASVSQVKNAEMAKPAIEARAVESPRFSIVVLPFANLSDDKHDEHFADGLTDDLTTALSQWKSSFVIARSTAFIFKGKAVDVKSIGRELGVRYLLGGSVRRSNDRVRVGVQLIDTESGGHLWADRFDRKLNDLLDMQDEITARIVLALQYTMIDVVSCRAREAAAEPLFCAASDESQETLGTVRITASEVMGAEVVPAMLARFGVRHPRIAVELAFDNRTEDVVPADADIAVRMARPRQEALMARRIGKVGLGLYAHRRYLTACGEPQSLDALQQHRIIGFDRDPSRWQSVGPTPVPLTRDRFAFRSDSDLAQLAALRAGFGIGGCQHPIAARDHALIPVLPSFGFSLEIWLSMHEDVRATRGVQLLFDHLAVELGAYAAPESG